MSAKTFELFVADRYLRAKRKQAVISVITVISIAGVAAGVMALVIAIAINNGFRSTLQTSLLGTTAHVMIQEKEPANGIENWKQLEPQLRMLPHVASVAAGLYGTVLLSGPLGGQASGAEVKGVPLDTPPDMLLHLKQGSFAALKDTSGPPGIILGSRLAQSTGMTLGAVANVMSPQGELTPFGVNPNRVRFRVVGIFESGKAQPSRIDHPAGTHFTTICAPSSMPPTIPLFRRSATPSCSEPRTTAQATTRP